MLSPSSPAAQSPVGAINVHQSAQCHAWARIFDVSCGQLIAAVKAVGEDAEAVFMHLLHAKTLRPPARS